jgi:hypothetical protein
MARKKVIEIESNEVKIARMEEKIDGMSGDIKDIKKALTDHIKREDMRFDELSDKFASKWVEKVVYGVVFLVLITVIGAVLRMVIK